MQSSDKYWDLFIKTGRIEDYLSFRRAADMEAAMEIDAFDDPEDDENEPENGRYSDP